MSAPLDFLSACDGPFEIEFYAIGSKAKSNAVKKSVPGKTKFV